MPSCCGVWRGRGAWTASHSREEFQESFARFRSRSFETDTAALLARFKRREYVRVMLRDVLGIATLAETTAELSALADVLIEEALREVDAQLQHRFGTPRELTARAGLWIRVLPCSRWASSAVTN